jgi:hypothetical protein
MVARAFERDSLFTLTVGPMVWAAHFLIVYITAAIACAHGAFDDEVLGIPIVQAIGGVATLTALALVLDGLVLSWRRWRGRPFDGESAPLPPHDGADVVSRRRFMAYASVLLSGISLIAIVWQSLPLLFFASCR